MLHMFSDNYEMYFDRRSVTIYSTERLMFEPKHEYQFQFKRDVRNAVEQLFAAKGESITAVYGVDNDKGFIDTENALFYNMGTPAFQRTAQHGIAFNTLSPIETKRLFVQAGKPQYHHYYAYQISCFNQYPIKPLLSWDKIESVSFSGDRKPFHYWKLLREHLNKITVFDQKDYIGRFGVEIHLYEPEIKVINLASPMKALLDGVICAFHRMPVSVDENLLTEISARLNLPVEQFLHKEKTIFGEEVFVKPYRNNIIWNPQDSRCSSVSMSIEYGAETRCFSGKIYKINNEDESIISL